MQLKVFHMEKLKFLSHLPAYIITEYLILKSTQHDSYDDHFPPIRAEMSSWVTDFCLISSCPNSVPL